jgi:predicted GNAT family acetyltransferase
MPHDTDRLDRAIWHALTTSHQAFSVGDAQARRYASAFAPFAATIDDTPSSMTALARLIPPGDRVALFTPETLANLGGLRLLFTRPVEQMLAPLSEATPRPEFVRVLGAGDVEAMRALVDLTKPGPFESRTHELGQFLGIHEDGQLIAMTGERMRLEGFTEMTAVCVHPDHRGRGFARALLEAVRSNVVGRGDTPYLHVFADNAPAIALYKSAGFTLRRRLVLSVLGRDA